MPSVVVSIGPAPGASARAWLVAARRTLETVRHRPDLDVPDDVLASFDGYLATWAAEMAGDEFRWEGEVDPAVLRHLAAHWARLVTLAREADGGSGLAPADPAGEAFFDALAAGIADGLSRADDAERFAQKFEEVVPAFDEVKPSPPADAGSRRRVLLVDDNPDIRLLVRIGLESSGGFTIVGEACDGKEAVQVVEEACPDLVLLDLAMPVMDGFEALPLLRERCPSARIVVFSASDSPTTRERISASGSDGFLRKDAAIAEVVATLRSL